MGWVVGRALRGLRTFARRNPLSAFWGCVAALIILVAILAPLIAPYDPLKANFRRMAKAPDAENYFGTDQIGRDNLSRIIYGARASLVVAIAAVLLGTTTGSLWGLASGYIGGSFDIVSQRIDRVFTSVSRPDPGHGDFYGAWHWPWHGHRSDRHYAYSLWGTYCAGSRPVAQRDGLCRSGPRYWVFAAQDHGQTHSTPVCGPVSHPRHNASGRCHHH